MRIPLALLALFLLGAAAPEAPLRFSDLEGRAVAVAPEPDRPLILHFWATWCPSCVDELPVLAALAARCKESAQTLAINVGEDAETFRAFAKEQGLALAMLGDPRATVWRKLDGRGLPTNFFWSSREVSLEPGPHGEAWWRERFSALGCPLSS